MNNTTHPPASAESGRRDAPGRLTAAAERPASEAFLLFSVVCVFCLQFLACLNTTN